MDEIEPPCQAGEACLVPPMGAEGLRIMELRGLLLSLRDLVDPGTVCRLAGADLEDLQMLARVETILKELHPEKEPHGQGH